MAAGLGGDGPFPGVSEDRSITRPGILGYVFGDREDTCLIFNLDSIRGVEAGLDLARFGSKPGDHVANRPALKLRDHERPVLRIFPDPQFMRRMPQHFFSRIAVSAFKGSVDIDKTTFRKGGDGKRDGARAEYFLELLFRDPTAFLGLEQRCLSLAKILDPSFEFFPINGRAFVKAGILDRCCRRNCQQFRPSKMILSKAIGLNMANRKKSQVLARGDQWHAQPRAQMNVLLEG